MTASKPAVSAALSGGRPAGWRLPDPPVRGSVRLSGRLWPTLRDAPADAEAVSHILMVRAGLVRQLAAGL